MKILSVVFLILALTLFMTALLNFSINTAFLARYRYKIRTEITREHKSAEDVTNNIYKDEYLEAMEGIVFITQQAILTDIIIFLISIISLGWIFIVWVRKK